MHSKKCLPPYWETYYTRKRGSSMPAGYARPSPEAGPHQAATTAPTHGASAKLERPRPAKGGANTQMSPSFANSGHWFHSTWSCTLNNSAVECRVLWNQLPDLGHDYCTRGVPMWSKSLRSVESDMCRTSSRTLPGTRQHITWLTPRREPDGVQSFAVEQFTRLHG